MKFTNNYLKRYYYANIIKEINIINNKAKITDCHIKFNLILFLTFSFIMTKVAIITNYARGHIGQIRGSNNAKFLFKLIREGFC